MATLYGASRWALLIAIAMASSIGPTGAADRTLDFDTSKVAIRTDERYLSVTVDWGVVSNNFSGFNLTSKVGRGCAKALSPALLRLGGTSGDYGWYNVLPDEAGPPFNNPPFPVPTYKFNATAYSLLAEYAADAGWDFVIGANAALRTPANVWNSTNFETLLKFSREQSGRGIFGWELSNEPDLFPEHNFTVPADQLARDFTVLASLVGTASNHSLIIGPDIADKASYLQTWCETLVKLHAQSVVDRVTWHHYYGNSASFTLNDFVSPQVLDKLHDAIDGVLNAVRPSLPTTPIWLGETSSTYGGGSSSYGESFVAGFMWLDKLGMAAAHGITLLARQDFYGGRYALIKSDGTPTPDFFTALLFKTLVSTDVITVQGGFVSNETIRGYAFCARPSATAPAGSLVVLLLNVQNRTAVVAYGAGVASATPRLEYVLTSGAGGLTSPDVMLNGAGPLRVAADGSMPTLTGVPGRGSTTSLPPYSYGYVVLAGAKAAACSAVGAVWL